MAGREDGAGGKSTARECVAIVKCSPSAYFDLPDELRERVSVVHAFIESDPRNVWRISRDAYEAWRTSKIAQRWLSRHGVLSVPPSLDALAPRVTNRRGPLLVCASSGPWLAGTIRRHALCVVDLLDVVPFGEEHLEAACMGEMPERPGYAWLLGEPSFVVPFEVKRRLHLFDVDDGLVRYIEDVSAASFAEFAERHYGPLVRWEDRETPHGEVEAVWGDWMGCLRECDGELAAARGR